MNYVFYFLYFFCFASVCFNFYLLKYLFQNKQKPQSQELKDFIRDLTDGAGWAVFRIDPDNILLRSPKR